MSPRQTTRRPSATASKSKPKKVDPQTQESSLKAALPLLETEEGATDEVAGRDLDKKEDSALAPNFLPLSVIILPATQPRRYFDPKAMQSLVESVRREGILQPLLVRPIGDKYELVAGERRYKAAQECSLSEVPVTVRVMSDTQAIQYALTENLQREDLNPVEETEGILDLLALRLSTDREGVVTLLNKLSKAQRGLVADNDIRQEKQIVAEVFASIGKMSPEAFRTHRLPLLNLPSDILDALRYGQIEYTKAREIAKLESEEERSELLHDAIEFSLSVAEIRKQVVAKKPKSEFQQLQARWENAYKQSKKSKLWEQSDKRDVLESLLTQLEELLVEKG
ncbi:ParB/RepB/Spo0J family partition protein [Anabaena sphaerica FACHB-251]|uniref:ParB/RepB/Spo0J family partition protein n=1 Tax=Anabaena sphaerica FACHB-251 TaxID=2692883 RepID=A0A927A3X3_9NOST|nr:ParB/RepB/Spo0J family partition protein [Anabaena sphaerica]MBD2296948.1 ParB/RepB/Spo0J family partition protein [Anabaena sphaerica FACHB-251]